jgi:ABC-2 type transport system permease protein
MKKTWQVAWHEYRQHVFNRRFLLGLLSVPLLVSLMIGLIFLITWMENNSGPIGYVDNSDLLANPLPPPPVEAPERPIVLQAFTDETSARSALDAGQIQAYYVIPQDYLTTGQLRVVHIKKVQAPSESQFYDFLAVNLLREQDPLVVQRFTTINNIIVRSVDGSREISNNNWFTIIFPMIAGIAFVVAMFTSGGYLMQAMVDEKENRTMEVIITSVSPSQFMTGKIVADISIGLTQIAAWVGFISGAILLTRNEVEILKGIQVSSQTLLLVFAIMLPGFVMVAALMALIGATVAEAREGQQVVGLISLPIWIPYMLTGLLIQNPNSPLAVALSFFPLTGPLTMLIRDGVTIIPAWQIATASAIMLLSAAGAIWLAGRGFRLGMLRYGKRLAWREIFARQGGRA